MKSNCNDEYDDIYSPLHYTKDVNIEPITYILDHDMGYIEGNIIKYITRYKLKNGVEDLKKAGWYLDRLIEIEGERGQDDI